ncbi:hypothetical protein T01_6347 [Trichinella spiralis]|uniref:Uncharacterized protein n=1 Tax=Trichinella spiralis TaxID=6334 RepID=A0A0V1AUC8_TRISP|nr:hypothetical protein T01_6347 [Trichinella spiralis]
MGSTFSPELLKSFGNTKTQQLLAYHNFTKRICTTSLYQCGTPTTDEIFGFCRHRCSKCKASMHMIDVRETADRRDVLTRSHCSLIGL